MITHPGEYHDADSRAPIPQSRQTLETIERGRLMPPLPVQVALRGKLPAQVMVLPVRSPAPREEAA
ncbi:hypothetical protein FDK12_09325 [Arthrobacter sp. NamB2]|uniref:hypothetical protein n=1 Tax=Arthrobacter sp. NamB2 TaxID=2576035 RepID=UPI0010C97C34|nr:hypothetical protein [Arthrobacter sp. NamB2]TKV28161.1 hypothetical protein FDK12_09325 [Arthrobacter sp. NamB2]